MCEGEKVNTTFQLDVKGTTSFANAPPLGTILADPITAGIIVVYPNTIHMHQSVFTTNLLSVSMCISIKSVFGAPLHVLVPNLVYSF